MSHFILFLLGVGLGFHIGFSGRDSINALLDKWAHRILDPPPDPLAPLTLKAYINPHTGEKDVNEVQSHILVKEVTYSENHRTNVT